MMNRGHSATMRCSAAIVGVLVGLLAPALVFGEMDQVVEVHGSGSQTMGPYVAQASCCAARGRSTLHSRRTTSLHP